MVSAEMFNAEDFLCCGSIIVSLLDLHASLQTATKDDSRRTSRRAHEDAASEFDMQDHMEFDRMLTSMWPWKTKLEWDDCIFLLLMNPHATRIHARSRSITSLYCVSVHQLVLEV